MNDDLKESILSIFEASLDAQLRAVRRLRHGDTNPAKPSPKKGLSQVDMAYDVLKKTRSPLHISALLDRIQASFGVSVDRESLVSSLTKKVARQDRFLRALPLCWRLSWISPPTGVASSLNRAPSSVPCAKLWARWYAWAGAVCRASFGPTAASIAVGARSTFSIPVVIGSRRSCFVPSSNGAWLTVPVGW